MTQQTRIGLLVAAMMSLAMALFFSGLFTFLALGPTRAWLAAWGRGLAIGWPLGFVLSALIGGPIRALALRLAGGPRG